MVAPILIFWDLLHQGKPRCVGVEIKAKIEVSIKRKRLDKFSDTKHCLIIYRTIRGENGWFILYLIQMNKKARWDGKKSTIKEGEKKAWKKDESKGKKSTSSDVKNKNKNAFASNKKLSKQRQAEFSEKSRANKGVKKNSIELIKRWKKKDKKTEKKKPNWNLRDAERAAEQAEKEALQALKKEKHAAEIQDVPEYRYWRTGYRIGAQIHVASIAGRIPKEKVDSLPKTKEKIPSGTHRTWWERDIDVSKPLTPRTKPKLYDYILLLNIYRRWVISRQLI